MRQDSEGFLRLIKISMATAVGQMAVGHAHHSPCCKYRLSSSMMARITSHLMPLLRVLQVGHAQSLISSFTSLVTCMKVKRQLIERLTARNTFYYLMNIDKRIKDIEQIIVRDSNGFMVSERTYCLPLRCRCYSAKD